MDTNLEPLPYLPKGKKVLYADKDNQFMQAAKNFALTFSKDKRVKTGSVIVKNGKTIGMGANGSEYHETNPCLRAQIGAQTGQNYELCEGCHTKNHSERKAIEDAEKNGGARGADLYMWGHWWCCEACWQAMEKAGIENVYLTIGAQKLFKKENS